MVLDTIHSSLGSASGVIILQTSRQSTAENKEHDDKISALFTCNIIDSYTSTSFYQWDIGSRVPVQRRCRWIAKDLWVSVLGASDEQYSQSCSQILALTREQTPTVAFSGNGKTQSTA